MSVSDDVGNLFRRFGGDAGQYQEVARDDEAKQAALRWPLLNALDIAHAEPVPDAERPATPASTPGFRVDAAVPPSPAQAAAPAGAESAGTARLPLFARGHRHATMPPPVTRAQTGANRFSAPPGVSPATERAHAAANASAVSTAPAAASAVASAAGISRHAAVAPTPSAGPAARVPADEREAQSIPAASFLSKRQTFARAPFNNPIPASTRIAPSAPAQQGGSILSNLFGGKPAAPREAPAAASSKDLSTLFARLSRGPAAPARSLRDTFRSRFKADGDA